MKKVASLACLLTLVFTTWAQRAVPELWGHRIHDEAHILTQATVDNLEATLRKQEDSTTNQIAVLIIPSLEGEVLEEYSMRVAHDVWKLGTRNNDNGVLLLIAVDDRKMRIEVGYGLESVLTDALTSRIIRNEIAPHFRNQEYDAGVTAGVNAIVAAIGNEYSTADSSDTSGNSSLEMDMTWQERLLIGAFIFGILGLFTAIGIFIPGCGGWLMYAFLIPFYAVFPLAVVGVTGGMILLGIYTIGFPIVRILLGRSAWGKNVMNNLQSGKGSGGKRGGGGGWASGSGWSSGRSSGWSSSGSSSGGFSGGGGSFGGGGSSGSW